MSRNAANFTVEITATTSHVDSDNHVNPLGAKYH